MRVLHRRIQRGTGDPDPLLLEKHNLLYTGTDPRGGTIWVQ